jgi:hypothetical protein
MALGEFAKLMEYGVESGLGRAALLASYITRYD